MPDDSTVYMSKRAEKREVVKQFYSAGYNLIPLCPQTKNPLVKWKEWQAQRIPVDTFCRWSHQFTGCNWAVLTGVKPYADTPGIIVIDADDQQAVEWVERKCPPTPLMQRTAGGGTHYIYRRGELAVRNATKLGGMNLDIRGDGGYILLPHSTTAKGIYTPTAGNWHDPVQAVAACPEYEAAWLAPLNPPEAGERETPAADADHDQLVAADWLPPVEERTRAARKYLNNCPGAQQGNGADKLAFRLACKLAGYFALPVEQATEVLFEWGQRDDQLDAHGLHYPWKWAEIAHKVRDAAAAVAPEEVGAAYVDSEFTRIEAEVGKIIGTGDDGFFDGPGGAVEAAELPPEYIADDVRPPKPKESGEDRRRFQDANELLNLPDPTWLIEGVLIENAFGMVYGLPGCFKTFLALDMALSLAHGLPFLGRFDVAGEIPVAYITPEGTAGLKHRLKAWMLARGIDRLRNVQINRHAFRLNEPEEAEAVIRHVAASGAKPRVLFIDTLARNFGGGDENSTKDMNNFVNNTMELAAALQLAVVVIHHAGKDTSKGARGSIALTGAVDLSVEMVKAEDGKSATVRCRKQKEAEEFTPFVVRVEKTGPSLSLAYDADAKAVTEPEQANAVTVDDLLPVLTPLPDTEAAAATISTVVEKTGKPRTTVRRYLDLAVRHGYASRATGTPLRYYLSPQGRAKVGG